MTGIINLISEYSSKLNILPIIVVMNIIITILIHFLTKKKIIKYLPSFAMLIAAIVIFVYALSIFTTSEGLNLSWIAVFLASAGLVGIFVSLIIDLIKSINKNSNVMVKNEKTIKKQSKRKSNPNRVAKKNRKVKEKNTDESKFFTKKIDTKNINNKVTAHKINKKNYELRNNKEDR